MVQPIEMVCKRIRARLPVQNLRLYYSVSNKINLTYELATILGKKKARTMFWLFI